MFPQHKATLVSCKSLWRTCCKTPGNIRKDAIRPESNSERKTRGRELSISFVTMARDSILVWPTGSSAPFNGFTRKPNSPEAVWAWPPCNVSSAVMGEQYGPREPLTVVLLSISPSERILTEATEPRTVPATNAAPRACPEPQLHRLLIT